MNRRFHLALLLFGLILIWEGLYLYAGEEALRNPMETLLATAKLLTTALFWSNFDFGTDASDRSSNRRAGDRREDGYCGVTAEDADGPPPGWWPEVGPYDVAALYHSGAVSAASREAAETMAGSWGTLR